MSRTEAAGRIAPASEPIPLMTYTGIDYHKRYSVASSQDEHGARLAEARINGNLPQAFAAYFAGMPGPHRVVIEACWNWPWLYDRLRELPHVESVVVAHPGKTRIIGEAQIKTDKIDARALCTLLRGNLVATVHVPSSATRASKHRLRQRLSWARLRTQLRNRVHCVLARQRDLTVPGYSDLFGTKGRTWLKNLKLTEPDHSLLHDQLAVLTVLDAQIKQLEKVIEREHADNPMVSRLQSLPGMGKILGAVVACEIEDIGRFVRSEKLCAYAGLVPTTYASGGKIHHGRLLHACNHYLQWAFIEAAWIATRCDEYFRGIYRRHRARGKGANEAIAITARRMCQITWSILKENRDYTEACPKPIPLFPAAAIKT